ncbi:hypothetical protein FP435_01055 [Lactobacillus sp. PV037]|uniref:hypothetical protein n=1 Tax=Lactobacillus sp. PV037 TaxID=2594496 RepID=UPI00223EC6F4|nr:hypothetical protein [Lactobacillus sp. PV037]QNQ83125.1 hypothetical protein FP435_01055 [Lactobacillus sp. PV037]
MPVLIECKTFTNPHSLKDYINQLDKMVSSGYLKKDTNHIHYFQSIGQKNSDDNVFKGEMKRLKNWDKSYGIFLSNIIIPIKYKSKWKKVSDLIFVYDIDLYKLLTNRDLLNKDFIWLPYADLKRKIELERILNKERIPTEFKKLIERHKDMDTFILGLVAFSVPMAIDNRGSFNKRNCWNIENETPSLELKMRKNMNPIIPYLLNKRFIINDIDFINKRCEKLFNIIVKRYY